MTFHPQYTKFGAAKLPSAGRGLQKTTPESLTESSFTPLPQGTILLMVDSRTLVQIGTDVGGRRGVGAEGLYTLICGSP